MSDDLLAEARNRMVDSQLRPNRVIDPRIIGAMRRMPRERFLPANATALAYADQEVPLGNNRALLQPMAIARLVQLAAPLPGEHALVVAAGTGYGAALLSACGPRVTALEEDAALLSIAHRVLPELAPAVSLVAGSLAAGWPSEAPYDIILLEGAVQAIPPALAQQLRNHTGRLVTVICKDGLTSSAVLAEAAGAGLRAQPMFDCPAPELPSLRPTPAFVF
ncbi:MAG TPA: protein-L-isoaspartate O-methyltransferase [Acetobacteraceae bacterium]|nr:protein-L-isoaspartate O-methyltransferase [Acetobacteraceae bacterium]